MPFNDGDNDGTYTESPDTVNPPFKNLEKKRIVADTSFCGLLVLLIESQVLANKIGENRSA